MLTECSGHTALITGSGTGIGLAIAKEFVKHGANVIILGRRPDPLKAAVSELERLATECGSASKVRMFAGVDVADEAAITGMFDELERDGTKLDVVVNNAGVSGPVTCFANASERDFESTVNIHLTGTFWTSMQALRVIKEGSRILTITTFFTEERPLEQRPYRFRTPYTAAQGAKNRLAESLASELVPRKVISIATNPGPVHSDRIYKTVYPKAAAEFLRVSGFEQVAPKDVEAACSKMLPALGEGDDVIKAAANEAASLVPGADADTFVRMLEKISSIAEKIQRNTAAMIADGQFLSQEQVAQTVTTICGSSLATTLNGKVIPGDRVFYPVKPHIGAQAPLVQTPKTDVLVIVVGAADGAGADLAASLAKRASKNGSKIVMIIGSNVPEAHRGVLSEFHSHDADLSDSSQVTRWLGAASQMGSISVVHVTGNLDPAREFCSLSRAEWDALVSQFVFEPARTMRAAFEIFVPGGSSDPRLYKDASGRVCIIGPKISTGKDVPRGSLARAEVFRGALRPFVTTANQELSDVLGSKVRVFLLLPGSVGKGVDGVDRALDYALSTESDSSSEVTFCTDEHR